MSSRHGWTFNGKHFAVTHTELGGLRHFIDGKPTAKAVFYNELSRLARPRASVNSRRMNMKSLATPSLVAAENLMRKMQTRHGGQWIIDKHVDRKAGTRWQVHQVATQQELNKKHALMAAQMYADPNFQPFNPDAKIRFGNYYKQRDDLKASLDKWAARFAADPLNAFEWGTDAIETAAEYSVVCKLIAHHEHGVSLENNCAWIEDYVQRGLEYSLRLGGSPSPMYNLAKWAKNNAYCKIAKQLRSFVDTKNKAIGDLWAYSEGLA